jgi:23S rRNA-intervening sequence protein
MPYNYFTEMPVWQKADEIVGEVYRLTEDLPKREDYALCSQFRNAAVSIAGNIAEGFGRGHKKDKINFFISLEAVVLRYGVICKVEEQLDIFLMNK